MGTRVTRAGLPPSTQGAPFMPGPTFAGPYHAAGDPARVPLTYGRFHNPTWTAYEQALSELEGGSRSLCVRYGGRSGHFGGCPPPWQCRRVTCRQLLHDAGTRRGLFHADGRPGTSGSHAWECPATGAHRRETALAGVPE